MNCVLFAKMDEVFSQKNKTLKTYWKKWKIILGKSGNFVSLEKWEPRYSNVIVVFLQVIQDLKLLPFTAQDVDQKVNAFRNYTDEVGFPTSYLHIDAFTVSRKIRKKRVWSRTSIHIYTYSEYFNS